MVEEEKKEKMAGIQLAGYMIGAVRPDPDKPEGFLWARGTVENSMNIPLTGLVVLTGSQGDNLASGQQRVLTGGLLRSLFNPQAKKTGFDFEVPVEDIGDLDSVWNVKIKTGNLLGRFNTVEEKTGEVKVWAFKVIPTVTLPPVALAGDLPGAVGAT